MIIPAGTRYTKPILLLTNKNSVSAAEHFTLALRTQEEHVTHAGITTCGAFSPREERPMINGWYYSISGWKVTGMDETIYEGIGIIPSVEISRSVELTNDEDDGKKWYRLQDTDTQLERALKYLVKKMEG
jgi:C-terminal processing protease CtpA/Prc